MPAQSPSRARTSTRPSSNDSCPCCWGFPGLCQQSHLQGAAGAWVCCQPQGWFVGAGLCQLQVTREGQQGSARAALLVAPAGQQPLGWHCCSLWQTHISNQSRMLTWGWHRRLQPCVPALGRAHQALALTSLLRCHQILQVNDCTHLLPVLGQDPCSAGGNAQQ